MEETDMLGTLIVRGGSDTYDAIRGWYTRTHQWIEHCLWTCWPTTSTFVIRQCSLVSKAVSYCDRNVMLMGKQDIHGWFPEGRRKRRWRWVLNVSDMIPVVCSRVVESRKYDWVRRKAALPPLKVLDGARDIQVLLCVFGWSTLVDVFWGSQPILYLGMSIEICKGAGGGGGGGGG